MRTFISIFLVSSSVFFVCGREIVLLQSDDGNFEELPQFLEPPKANQVSEYDSSTLEVKKDVGRKKYKPEEEFKKSYEWVEGEDFKQWEINCLMDEGKCNQKLENIKNTILSALSDGCKSCSVPEKLLAGNAAAIMMFRQPRVWQQFIEKYDKDQTFMKQHS